MKVKPTKLVNAQEMEALSVLGVVHRIDIGGHATVMTLSDRFQWFVSDECSSLMISQRR
jgi:hypothetical protein